MSSSKKDNSLMRVCIPGELIEWGKDADVSLYWPRPWAHEVESICKSKQPLDEEMRERLFSRLEALAIEAIRASRQDLLHRMDLWTAAAIGLRLHLTDGQTSISVGQFCEWTYVELDHVLGSSDPAHAMSFSRQAKELLSESFPDARIDAIIEPPGAQETCAGCGTQDTDVWVDMDTKTAYCGQCVAAWTKPPPVIGRKKSKKK